MLLLIKVCKFFKVLCFLKSLYNVGNKIGVEKMFVGMLALCFLEIKCGALLELKEILGWVFKVRDKSFFWFFLVLIKGL